MKYNEFTRRYGVALGPPRRRYLLAELLTPAYLTLDPAQYRRLPRSIDGKGRPVMLLPGLGAGPASMTAIRRYLRRCNFRTWDWAQGRNRGDVQAQTPRVVERLEKLVERAGAPFALVGWSLGGYIAREITRDRPDLVSRVVTLGSPVLGGAKYTSLANRYQRRGVAVDEIETVILDRYDIPLQRPVRAIYSASDGIVSWQASIDRFSEDVEHIRVPGTHMGLGFSKRVLRQLPGLLVDDPAQR